MDGKALSSPKRPPSVGGPAQGAIRVLPGAACSGAKPFVGGLPFLFDFHLWERKGRLNLSFSLYKWAMPPMDPRAAPSALGEHPETGPGETVAHGPVAASPAPHGLGEGLCRRRGPVLPPLRRSPCVKAWVFPQEGRWDGWIRPRAVVGVSSGFAVQSPSLCSE